MIINYSSLQFTFSKKPLLVGGKAMEYYGLRKAGEDIDFVVPKEDLVKLLEMYPEQLKNLQEDLGVALQGFEIWKTIDYFDYDYLSQNAIEESNYLVISLEKLLLQKAMAMHKPKYHEDLELVVKRITEDQLLAIDEVKMENETILKKLR
jgi:hypothetical protein